MRPYTEGNLAPIVIKFLIACHTSPDPMAEMGEEHWKSPAGIETREFLFKENLINACNKTTSRGRAWLEMLLETPLPVKEWIDPRKGHNL